MSPSATPLSIALAVSACVLLSMPLDAARAGQVEQVAGSGQNQEEVPGAAEAQVESAAASVEREVSGALLKIIDALLTDWKSAVMEGSSEDLVKLLDTHGVHRRSLALAPLEAFEEPLQVLQFTKALLSELTASQVAPWDEIEILRALINDQSGTISVTTCVTSSVDGIEQEVFRRWILTKGEESWRVVDSIDLRSGVALSWISTHAFADNPEAPEWIGHVDELQRGVDFLNKSDKDGVAWALGALEGISFPPPLTGTLDILRAHDSQVSGRSDAALRWLGEARRRLPALPQIDRMQALVHGSRGEWADVLVSVQAYTQELPGDAELYFVAGQAAAALGRNDEASDAFRAGLAVTPQSVDNLLGLARSLASEDLQELRESFRRLDNPNEWFEPLVIDLLGSGDLDAVEALIAELRRIAPDDPNGDYFEATMLMERGQLRAAADLLKAAFPKVADPVELRFYVQQYVDACVLLEVPLEAYDNSPDRPFVFDLLCSYFLEVGHTAELKEVVMRHELEFPEDPWLPYYRAELLRSAGDLEAAGLRFEEGMINATGLEIREVYRWNLVRVRIEAGEGMRAYAEIEPAEDTFRQLVLHGLESTDRALMDALIAARRVDQPDDPKLPLLDGVVAFWANDYPEALKQIQAARASLGAEDKEAAHIERALILSAIRTGALELAQREALRSTQRDGDPFFEAIVFAAQGEHQLALEALMTCMEEFEYEASTFYGDPDLAPALLSHEAYTFFRRRYPPPSPAGDDGR